MAKVYNGLNLLNFQTIAYAQWIVSHANLLPALQVAGAALISETSTIKQRAKAVRDVVDILITAMDDAPDKIFGAEGEAPESAFAAIGDEAETKGLNVLLLIEIVSLVMKFINRK